MAVVGEFDFTLIPALYTPTVILFDRHRAPVGDAVRRAWASRETIDIGRSGAKASVQIGHAIVQADCQHLGYILVAKTCFGYFERS